MKEKGIDNKQAAARCHGMYRQHKQKGTQYMKREFYQFDCVDDGACAWITSDEGNYEFSDEDGSYSAVAVIGDRFYKGKFFSYDELKKSFKGMDGTFHDINHFGTSYPAGLFSRSNIEWVVGYQKGTMLTDVDKKMRTKIYIEDSAPKANVWKSFMKICEKAGRVPNVSISFWANSKDVLASDLPDGADYASQGYRNTDMVPYLYDYEFKALSTVFQGACDDKAGCGIGIYNHFTIEDKKIADEASTGEFIDLGKEEQDKRIEELKIKITKLGGKL